MRRNRAALVALSSLFILEVGVAGAANPAATKRVVVGPNVALEVEGKQRRVVVEASVCLREGLLEQLLCRQNTKEHEAILHADADARDIHQALLLTGAKPGSTVRYGPTFQPPTGTSIRVTLRYQDNGKQVSVPGGNWVRNVKTRKALDLNWVFAGSLFAQDPLHPNQPPLYAANGGDVICVSNFEDAMLDLPIASSNDDSELLFEAFTERIPPVNTKVQVILEPASDGASGGLGK